MIGASKILTVSYGTFSCTLEGFEDPFNTMKAIAEYFRDLAAEDRYFGAEPPTPDAAMLHRIAEREIQRRVEAKIQDNGVILRAAEIAEPVVAPAAAPQPAAAPAPAAAPSPLLAEESVAAKLQRIRSAVARSAAAAAAAPAIEDAEIEDAVIAAEPAPEPAPESLVAHWEATVAVAEAEAPVAVEEPEEIIEAVVAAVATEAPAESAAEEALVEAVVAEPAWTGDADDELPEDVAALTAEDLPEAVADEADEELAVAPAAEAAEPLVLTETEIVAEAEAEAEVEADLSGVLAQLDTVSPDAAEPEAETVLAYAEAPAVTVAEEAVESELDVPVEPVAPATAEAYDDEIFEDDSFAEAAKAAAPAEEAALEPFEDEIAPAAAEGQTWPADPEAPAAAPEVSDKLRRARARVIKVRRPDAAEAALPPEAEAELQRELAAAATETETGRRAESEGRSILEAAASGDEDVTRLLRQTNTEMEGPESKRRMSTLAHLKAAVAATVAELRAPSPSAGTGEPSRLERYRADLARVVRPRRSGDAAPTERPAPLVLVSEQRIDRPSNTDAVPTRVMPRRVSSGNLALEDEEAAVEATAEAEVEADNIFASSKSFAEFAERLGASEMPDLLEAAAAYTSCIEGRPHFSRPHLMRYVAAVADEATLGREDGLRSFGQLLRQGKIEKVKRGQFAITDMSYYLAEARRMTR